MTPTIWQDDLRRYLDSEFYCPAAINEAVRFAERWGTLQCCPVFWGEAEDAVLQRDLDNAEALLPFRTEAYAETAYNELFVTPADCARRVLSRTDEDEALIRVVEPAPAQAFGRVLTEPPTRCPECGSLDVIDRLDGGGWCFDCRATWHVVPPVPEPEPARVVTSYPPDPAFGGRPARALAYGRLPTAAEDAADFSVPW